jgi:2-polyprenyl-6-methoxyphenol hydroxylase-like FAD-dependent oxidoreductase
VTKRVEIFGGGPAGAAAAIAAISETDQVRLVEKSAFPRHKVCGEFLSPGIAAMLDDLGLSEEFQQLRPARIRRVLLYIGKKFSQFTLPESAFGLSRYELDRMLLGKAAGLGVHIIRSRVDAPWRWRTLNGHECNSNTIIACGRKPIPAQMSRIFGFKAHFEGPVDDIVQLFFFRRCYVGVSAVENDHTNVCGLAPEEILRGYDFDIDEFLLSSDPLRDRIRPLARTMKWMTTGPLSFRNSLEAAMQDTTTFLAGDALGFVDPFTGTGILSALLTGSMAGRSAARGVSSAIYLRECRRALRWVFHLAALLRIGARSAVAEYLAPVLPGDWLYRMTRPNCGARPTISVAALARVK